MMDRNSRRTPGSRDIEALVDFEGVTKVYREAGRERVVLRDVSLRLGPSEFVVLAGRSGSGKSTLLNLISGIDRADTGRLCVCGRDLQDMSEHERTVLRRRQLGFVFQFFNLLPTLTVAENTALPLELEGWPPRRARERVYGLLERFGLRDLSDAFPDRLSGGEQQRVAVARAVAHDPPLILADEPVGNLDTENAKDVLDHLESRVREDECSVLMASHDPETWSRADRVLAIRDAALEVVRC